MRRRVPKQDRAVATVAAIVDAMAILVRERGLEPTTTNHVAERAGVNVGSVYQYFPSKAAIFDALVEDLVRRYETSLFDAFDRARRLALDEAIAELLRAHIAALARDAELHRLAIPHLRDTARVAQYTALKTRIVAALEDLLRLHPLEAGPSDEETASAARTAVDCVEAVTLASLTTRGRAFESDPTVSQLFKLAQRYLVRGT